MKKKYEADCIEHGEDFTTIFLSSETDKEKLLNIGQELAMEWGGECISVKEDTSDSEATWDADLTTDENLKNFSGVENGM